MPDDPLGWCIVLMFVVFIATFCVGIYYSVKMLLGKKDIKERM